MFDRERKNNFSSVELDYQNGNNIEKMRSHILKYYYQICY